MDQNTASFIPILFKVLFGFVCLNILVNLILLYTRRIKINKLLALYWPAILVQLFVQGATQQGDLAIALAYSSTLVSTMIATVFGFEAVGRVFPWKKYLAAC